MRRSVLSIALGLCVSASSASAGPIDVAFTYQGEVRDAGAPVTGEADFQFRLYDAIVSGNQVGPSLSWTGDLDGGRFTVDLDFGPGAYSDQERWLEIDVRSPAGSGAFVTLAPRQRLAPTPVALFALSGNAGPQGPQGSEGPQGPAGPPGPPGTTSWFGITDIPAGFSDGTDNDTTYSAASPLRVTGSTIDIDPSGASNGDVLKFNGAAWGPGTDLDTDTTYQAGAGLLLNATTFSLDLPFLDGNYLGLGSAAGGDLGGTYPSPIVDGIRGRPVSATTPAVNAVLKWTGSAWTPATDQDTQYSAGTALRLTGTTFSVNGSSIDDTLLAFDSLSLGKMTGGVLRTIGGGVSVASTQTPTGTLQIWTGGDVSATDSDGYLIVGESLGLNISLDNNEIMARTGSGPAALNMNIEGGNIHLGNDPTDGRVGVSTSSPSDRLHVVAAAGESAFRVQTDGTTRFRVNANGGVAIGANATAVAAGNAYIDGALGIGTQFPDTALHIGAATDTADGLFVENGSSSMLVAPARMAAATDYSIDVAQDLSIEAGISLTLDSAATTRIDGTTVDINGSSSVDIDAGGSVFIESSIFTGSDATIPDDLTIGNDAIVNSVLTVGGPEAFSFTINSYGEAGKPGGGLWANFSDRRLKRDIEPLDGVLDRLLALEGVTYEYIDPDHFSYIPGRQRGWIAQQVQDVFPEWVAEANDGFLYVKPQGYEAMVVESIRELRDEKDDEIEVLRRENQDLHTRLERLERALGLR